MKIILSNINIIKKRKILVIVCTIFIYYVKIILFTNNLLKLSYYHIIHK